jgi:hypothetical protein
MRRSIVLSFTVFLLVCAVAAASGYVVILKNGHKIRCKEPLRIEGPNAIITLATGVMTSYPLSQVDLIETERYNKMGLGDALLVEELSVQMTPIPTPTPKRALGHYAAIDRADSETVLGSTTPPTPTPTPGIKLQTSEYHDPRVTEAFRRILDEKKLYLYRMSMGSRPEYFFIQAVTDSEQEVFGALRTVSEAYVLIERLDPELAPSAVELQMVETSGKPAGTFRLTTDSAEMVAEQQISVEEFYVRNVIF